MEGQNLVIYVNWIWLLGIIGGIIVLAWKAGVRFTIIETDIKWIIRSLKKLDVNNENEGVGAFASNSPISLTAKGSELLNESGIKEYIDSNKARFLNFCEGKRFSNPYEVQQSVFQMFDELKFDEVTDQKLKKFAFDRGVSMGIIRRVGGIYFRDVCLENFGMKKDDIDVHDPKKHRA